MTANGTHDELAPLLRGYRCTVWSTAPQSGTGRTVKVLIPLIRGLALIGGFTAWALTRTTGALVNVRLFRHRAVASSSTLLFLVASPCSGR
ncbi:hypothetical protein [Streptomyces roseoverticillatus]|uniref:hypothetical protein n=1 Tax=Streptomyces roseoverticillatus TaxID=66429 RepID=UPI001F477661|nr:hypothetical protein [Streptomyces roseoverticillatus]